MQNTSTTTSKKKTRMWKWILVVAIILIAATLIIVNIETKICTTGIENFSRAQSSMELCNYIIPPYNSDNVRDEEYFQLFPYESADYYYTYKCKGIEINAMEAVLCYCSYSKETYSEAKNYIFGNASMFADDCFQYNGYKFFANKSFLEEYGTDNKFNPRRFVINGFNDEKNLLISLGFSASFVTHGAKKSDKTDLFYNDFGAFLKEYFKYYDFDAETPKIDVDGLENDYGKSLKR